MSEEKRLKKEKKQKHRGKMEGKYKTDTGSQPLKNGSICDQGSKNSHKGKKR